MVERVEGLRQENQSKTNSVCSLRSIEIQRLIHALNGFVIGCIERYVVGHFQFAEYHDKKTAEKTDSILSNNFASSQKNNLWNFQVLWLFSNL